MKKYILLDVFFQDGFYVTQSYGVNASLYKPYGLLWHEGIDFGHVNKKVIVRSPVDGIIVQDWDEPKGNYGKYVVIWDDSQNIAVWICHLDNNLVDYGDRVKAGDPIGEMGGTGNSTGEHIHLNFVITDSSGNRLYNSKSSNLGLLDPQYPRDPNPPKYPPGVEQYIIEWSQSISSPTTPPSNGGTMPNYYPSDDPKIDLNNIDAVKAAVDEWRRSVKGELVNRSTMEQSLKDQQAQLEKKFSDQMTEKDKQHKKEIEDLKKQFSENPPQGEVKPPVLEDENFVANGKKVTYVEDGKTVEVNYSRKSA